MNLYESEYRRKLVTLEEALDSLRDGDVIATSQCANEPTAIFDAMHTLRGKGKKYRMFAPMCFVPHEFMSDPIYRDTFDMDITFLMGATRRGRESGLFSFYPGDLAIPQALAAGVTTVCAGPGSSNVLGGTFLAVKLFGKKTAVKAVSLFVGLIVCYAFGTAWFVKVYTKDTTFGGALKICVLPFAAFDIVKLALAVILEARTGRFVFRSRHA